MFEKVSSCLGVYDKMLKTYEKKVQELKIKYGHEKYLSWDQDDYDFLIRWNYTFLAIEQVLDLSKEEIEQCMKGVDCGKKR